MCVNSLCLCQNFVGCKLWKSNQFKKEGTILEVYRFILYDLNLGRGGMWLDLRDNGIQTFKCPENCCSIQFSTMVCSACLFCPRPLQSNILYVAENTRPVTPSLACHSYCHQICQLSFPSSSSVKPRQAYLQTQLAWPRRSCSPHRDHRAGENGAGVGRSSQEKGALGQKTEQPSTTISNQKYKYARNRSDRGSRRMV